MADFEAAFAEKFSTPLCPGQYGIKFILKVTHCSKIRKKVQFQKYKGTFFATSKMAKDQFLHQKKV